MERDIERRFEECEEHYDKFHIWKKEVEVALNGRGFDKQGIFSKLQELAKEVANLRTLFQKFGTLNDKATVLHERVDDLEEDKKKEEKQSNRVWERLGIAAAILGVIWSLLR